jgi:hypothetical protein
MTTIDESVQEHADRFDQLPLSSIPEGKVITQALQDICDETWSFHGEMRGRMIAKHEQGYQGWDDPAFLPIYRRKLIECAARVYAGDSNQCVDLANWAMIIDYCESVKKERMSKAGAG